MHLESHSSWVQDILMWSSFALPMRYLWIDENWTCIRLIDYYNGFGLFDSAG